MAMAVLAVYGHMDWHAYGLWRYLQPWTYTWMSGSIIYHRDRYIAYYNYIVIYNIMAYGSGTPGLDSKMCI
jgi:hypothetical protein